MTSTNKTSTPRVRLQDSLTEDRPPSDQRLSPVSSPMDVGRRLLRSFGTLSLDQIAADPQQPRKHFDQAELQRLTESIKHKGQLQPIRVRWSPQQSKWIIVSGERRYLATKGAGLTSIECYFLDDEPTDSELLEEQLIENLLRQELRPMEEAIAYRQLMELNGWNGQQLAKAISVTPSRITRATALLKLAPEIQHNIDQGHISASAAYELTKLPPKQQHQALQRQSADDSGQITIAQVRSQGRRKRKKPVTSNGRTRRLEFQCSYGWNITAENSQQSNYHEVEQALTEALEEVRLRIDNRVELF